MCWYTERDPPKEIGNKSGPLTLGTLSNQGTRGETAEQHVPSFEKHIPKLGYEVTVDPPKVVDNDDAITGAQSIVFSDSTKSKFAAKTVSVATQVLVEAELIAVLDALAIKKGGLHNWFPQVSLEYH